MSEERNKQREVLANLKSNEKASKSFSTANFKQIE